MCGAVKLWPAAAIRRMIRRMMSVAQDRYQEE